MTQVLVPAPRVGRWLENFETRHGATHLVVADGRLKATAEDGAAAALALPWARAYDGAADPPTFTAAALEPLSWGLLLVRKGGFAVAAGTTPTPVERKVGRRHVQGRSKAGGWSQQRFARRRDQQARAAYEAAADHAARILPNSLRALVCGGDRSAVDAVLADRRLRAVGERRVEPWLAVPDPTPSVLAQAVADAWAVLADLTQPVDPEV